MNEIKELDDKYLVLKKDDLDKYFSNYTDGIFTTEKEQKIIDAIPFKVVLHELKILRELEGKGENRYLVLNLDDELDKNILCKQIQLRYEQCRFRLERMKVKDIAVDLVNAVLKAKEKS